ncbi:hypothetical protein AOX55_00004114 [Sinorhizobium fredii CCBAU 25509]|nr:hypothetical protein SF83666_c38760 [Sinorhizobium fredii CCBAU 83666]AWM27335.1 hypothetical protein AOX55_00004114 [Sinorhizobium fredii CCBAU 25509]
MRQWKHAIPRSRPASRWRQVTLNSGPPKCTPNLAGLAHLHLELRKRAKEKGGR